MGKIIQQRKKKRSNRKREPTIRRYNKASHVMENSIETHHKKDL